MTLRIFLVLMIFIHIGCSGQNSVMTNEIIKTDDNKIGVKSKSGKILMEPIYEGISKFYNLGRKTLPPNNHRYDDPVEFYQVRNAANQLAIFDKDGNMVYDFVDCFQLEVDAHTRTIVKVVRQEDNQMRSYLYEFGGKAIFETSFENIGYINDSDLIALIVEDGQNDEFYLYNSFTKNKLGPYSHFNVYNKDSSPPMGMEEEAFKPYTKLNIISVRQNMGNKYKWGLVDMKGNEILPIEYKYIRVLDKSFKKRFIDRASGAEGVDFLFYGYPIKDRRKLLLFDEKMEIYVFDQASKTIRKENK